MIVSTGVDIIEVDRVRGAVKKWGESFLKKVFTEKELKYSRKKKNEYQHLAARFATKEAVLKAFGGGWARTLPWNDVEIVNNKNGKPEIKLYREAKKISKKRKIESIVVSMSHTKNYAVANAVLTTKE